MTLHKDSLLIATLVLVALACVSVMMFTNSVGVGFAVQPNMQPRTHAMATTSVGIYTASTIATGAIENCATRVITTNDRLYISFDENLTPTGITRGHFQAASTTVAYDAENFGCGPITAISGGATTTLTVTTFKF